MVLKNISVSVEFECDYTLCISYIDPTGSEFYGFITKASKRGDPPSCISPDQFARWKSSVISEDQFQRDRRDQLRPELISALPARVTYQEVQVPTSAECEEILKINSDVAGETKPGSTAPTPAQLNGIINKRRTIRLRPTQVLCSRCKSRLNEEERQVSSFARSVLDPKLQKQFVKASLIRKRHHKKIARCRSKNKLLGTVSTQANSQKLAADSNLDRSRSDTDADGDSDGPSSRPSTSTSAETDVAPAGGSVTPEGEDVVYTAEDGDMPPNPYGLKTGDLVWARSAPAPWWPGRLFAVYPSKVSPPNQSACVVWFGGRTGQDYGFVRLETCVVPLLDSFSLRYKPSFKSAGYQRSVALALRAARDKSPLPVELPSLHAVCVRHLNSVVTPSPQSSRAATPSSTAATTNPSNTGGARPGAGTVVADSQGDAEAESKQQNITGKPTSPTHKPLYAVVASPKQLAVVITRLPRATLQGLRSDNESVSMKPKPESVSSTEQDTTTKSPPLNVLRISRRLVSRRNGHRYSSNFVQRINSSSDGSSSNDGKARSTKQNARPSNAKQLKIESQTASVGASAKQSITSSYKTDTDSGKSSIPSPVAEVAYNNRPTPIPAGRRASKRNRQKTAKLRTQGRGAATIAPIVVRLKAVT